MDTTVWSFLVVVVIISLIGYYVLKKYSIHYANKKTDKIINEFLKENELETENKSFQEIEKNLLAKEEEDDDDDETEEDKNQENPIKENNKNKDK